MKPRAADRRVRSAAQCDSYHDAAVLGATGDDVVVVGAELDVQHGPRVAAHGGVVHVDPARLQRTQPVSPQVAQLLKGRKSLASEESLG